MNDTSTSARAQFGKWYRDSRLAAERCERLIDAGVDPDTDVVWPAFPAAARGLVCGAKTRRGTPCRRRDVNNNGRCKLHGGLSTGPRTAAGRERAIANLKVRWRQGTP
jgi:hypothetical protein